MPFKSQKQRAWMYATHPAMAKRWEDETPKGKKLPKYAHGKPEQRGQVKAVHLVRALRNPENPW
jgi:hypothetical protein